MDQPSEPNTNASTPHILGAASNLLGICFVLVAGLKVSGASKDTYLDEVALVDAIAFVLSCLFSYSSLRTPARTVRLERMADTCFLVGLLTLTIAVVLYAFGALQQV